MSHASKVMLKIFHARIQQYMNQEISVYKLDLEKEEEPEIKLPTFTGSYRKLGNSRKNIYLCFISYAKGFDCVDHNKLGKLLKRWEYQTILPVSWETCMHVKKQQLVHCMEQLIGSRLRKYDRAVILFI